MSLICHVSAKRQAYEEKCAPEMVISLIPAEAPWYFTWHVLLNGFMSEDEDAQYLHEEIESLRNENARLRLKMQEMESEIVILESKTKSANTARDQSEENEELKRYYEDRIQNLTTRIRLSEEGKKEHLERCEEAQQIEKEHWVRKFESLKEKLKASENCVDELKIVIQEKEAEFEKAKNDNTERFTGIKHEERDALIAAGVYFHSSFPSLRSLTEFLSTKVDSKPATPQRQESEDDNESSRSEAKLHQKLRELKREKAQSNVDFTKLRAENEILKKENQNMKTRLSEVSGIKEKLTEAEEETEKLRTISREQKDTIAEQRQIIQSMTVEGPTAVQIARLKSENDDLKRRLKKATKKAKATELVTKVQEVAPELLWDRVEGPEIPRELQETLAKVIENGDLQVQAKFKLCLKTICSYYEERQKSLSTTSHKAKHRMASMTKNMSNFCESLSLLLIQRTTTVKEVAEDGDVQARIIDNVKKLKAELRDALIENRRLQRSYPSEKVVKLEASKRRYKEKVRELRQDVLDLRARVQPQMSGDAERVKKGKKRAKPEKQRKPDPKPEPIEVDHSYCQTCGRKLEEDDQTGVIGDLQLKISCLEAEREKLLKELEILKTKFDASPAPLESISEYENLLAQLRKQVDRQKETIEILSNQHVT